MYLPSTAAMLKITSLSKESCFSTVNRLHAYFAEIAIVDVFVGNKSYNDNSRLRLKLAKDYVVTSIYFIQIHLI